MASPHQPTATRNSLAEAGNPHLASALFFARCSNAYTLAVQFAAVQFDIIWEYKPANHAIIEQMIDASDVRAGAFVLLPELGDTGFSFNLDAIVDDQTLPWAQQCAQQRGIWLQVGYAIRGDDGRGRNIAAIISPTGWVRATYAKVHPFSFGREIEYFSGGDHIAICPVDGLNVAPMICYDLRCLRGRTRLYDRCQLARRPAVALAAVVHRAGDREPGLCGDMQSNRTRPIARLRGRIDDH